VVYKLRRLLNLILISIVRLKHRKVKLKMKLEIQLLKPIAIFSDNLYKQNVHILLSVGRANT